jgi:hypothetical protein
MNTFYTVNDVALVNRSLSTTGVPDHIRKRQINVRRSKAEKDDKDTTGG